MGKIISVFLLLSLSLNYLLQGQEVTEAGVDRSIEQYITPGETHSFLLDLDDNQFVYGEVVQKDVNVAISVFSPGKELISTIDWEIKGWEERFTFESSDAGQYRIEISPSDNDSGHYVLEIKQVQSLYENPDERVNQLFTSYYSNQHLGVNLGVAVAVFSEDNILFSRAYGMANLTHGIPFTTGTSSNIASVSKQFTGFAISLLEKEGKLSFDDDVREYIPEFPEFYPRITLRHLLNHTSGLREIWHTLLMQGVSIEGTWTRPEIIQQIIQQQELQFSPGERFSYNNGNYILLAEVIERITGVLFSNWMEAKVFRPLGMEHTRVKVFPGQIIPCSARGYAAQINSDSRYTARRLSKEEGGVREFSDINAFYGASSIYSTVGDLTTWLMNFNNAHIGGTEVIFRMTERGILTNGDTTIYGFGIIIDTYRGLHRYSHSGFDGGHRASIVYYPQIDAGIVILGNDMIFRGAKELITDMFFGKYLAPVETQGQTQNLEEETFTHRDKIIDWNPSENELSIYTGQFYSSELNSTYMLVIEKGQLIIKYDRFEDISLVPRKPDNFSCKWPFEELDFERGENGNVTGFVTQNVHFEKFK